MFSDKYSCSIVYCHQAIKALKTCDYASFQEHSGTKKGFKREILKRSYIIMLCTLDTLVDIVLYSYILKPFCSSYKVSRANKRNSFL